MARVKFISREERLAMEAAKKRELEEAHDELLQTMEQTRRVQSMHGFAKLPAELRELIWVRCLPHRVYEVDEPISRLLVDWNVSTRNYWERPYRVVPCELSGTSAKNKALPAIAQVCQEARAIAMKCHNEQHRGEWRSKIGEGPAHMYYSDLLVPHLRAPGCYLEEFVDHADHCQGGSLMFDFFHYKNSWRLADLVEEMRALTPNHDEHWDKVSRQTKSWADESLLCEARPMWLVVCRVIVIHCKDDTALRSGLFGSLADAPVQIVDASDRKLVHKFYTLAKMCEPETESDEGQLLSQEVCLEASDSLYILRESFLNRGLNLEFVADHVRTAVMFRLCTDRCRIHSEALLHDGGS